MYVLLTNLEVIDYFIMNHKTDSKQRKKYIVVDIIPKCEGVRVEILSKKKFIYVRVNDLIVSA